MKKLFSCVVIVLAIFFSIINYKANAQVGGVLVYPNVIELDFSKADSRFVSSVISVENPTSETLRIRAYIDKWDLDEYSRLIFPENNSENNAGIDNPEFSFIKFNPREFDLAPGQKQIVRLTAKMPEISDNESRSMIFFESVSPKEELLQPENKKLNLMIKFKTRFGVALYTYKGNISRKTTLQDVYIEKIDQKSFIIAILKNDGNIHSVVEGEYSLTSGQNSIKDKTTKFAILPGRTQKIKIELPEDKMESGLNYTASLKLIYKDSEEKQQVMEAQKNFVFEAGAKTSVKSQLLKKSDQDDIKKTPDNIAKPIKVDESEIKLNK